MPGKSKHLLTAISVCFLAMSGVAQVSRFHHLSIEQGLSQSTVFSVVQDNAGFIWFATLDGLNRYDGYHIRVYRHDPADPASLPDNYVNVLYVDRKGRLLIGLHEKGLCYYRPAFDDFATLMLDDKHGLDQGNIQTICEDENGKLWLGSDIGLNVVDMANGTVRKVLDGNVHALARTNATSVWVGTENGLFLVDDQNNIDTVSHAAIRAIEVESDSSLWFGTDNGLFRLNRETGVYTMHIYSKSDPLSLVDNHVNCLEIDKMGYLWVGTQGGISKINLEDMTYRNYTNRAADPMSLKSDLVYDIFSAEDGSVWIGTSLGGVDTWNHFDERFVTYRKDPLEPHTLSSNRIRHIYRDDRGIFWIGTVDAGLNRWDGNGFTSFQHHEDDPHSIAANHVRSILEDSEGALWIGTDGGGLDRMDRRRGTFVHFSHREGDTSSLSCNRVWDLLEDSKGNFWVATFGGGLNLFDRSNGTFYAFMHDENDKYSISDNEVTVVFEDHLGVLWVGTFGGGLNKWNAAQNSFTPFLHDENDEASISNNRIYSIVEDEDGELWIGTKGGLNHLVRETGRFERFLMKDGLPNDVVMGILDDGAGHLWLSTNTGISRFSKGEKTFRNFDINDGLQSNEFLVSSFFRVEDGKMFFGGINGFNAFYPSGVTDNKYEPKVAITGLQVFGRDVIYDSSITAKQLITLTHSDYNFSIEFVGLSYVHPNKNTYAYKMEGFDAGWNHAGNRRFATYTNLPPGSYVFKVKAANNDGIWSGRPASIRVEILPAFWQTLWFRGLLIMFMLLSAYFIHRIRVRNMQQQNRRLEKMVTKRTAEVVSQRDEIKKKNMLIEESFKEIQDSIRYAKRIQLAILPPDQYVEKLLPDSFLLYKPKDIVSGDFYWVSERDGRVFFAAVDCTGHGVPGAFMSIVGNNQLNNAVNVRNATSPSEILDALNEGVSGTLRQKDAHPDVKDGMDLALCAIDRKSMRLEFAGAYNPLYIIRKGIANQKLRIAGNYRFFEDDLLEVKADKVPIGGSESGSKFTNFEFELQQGDAIYIFSDGYADQFGGPLGKKYKYKTLKKKLLEIHEKPMQEQRQLLADEFGAWKGAEEQVDDVCLIGVRA